MAAHVLNDAGGGSTGTGDRSVGVVVGSTGLLIVILANISDNTNASMTCSDDRGGTYTRITTALWLTSTGILAAFVRDSLTSVALTHTVTVASGSNSAGQIGWVTVSGMSKVGASAVRSFGSEANRASGTSTLTLSNTPLSANMMIQFIGCDATNPNIVPPTGWVDRTDSGQSTPNTGVDIATRDSGHTSATVTAGSSYGSHQASIALELDTTNSASAGITLDPITCAATGTAKISGQASITLDPITCAATAEVKVQAALAVTLADITCVSEARVVGLEGSITLADITCAATATVKIQAQAAIELDDITTLWAVEKRDIYNYPVQPSLGLNEQPELGEFDLSLF